MEFAVVKREKIDENYASYTTSSSSSSSDSSDNLDFLSNSNFQRIDNKRMLNNEDDVINGVVLKKPKQEEAEEPLSFYAPPMFLAPLRAVMPPMPPSQSSNKATPSSPPLIKNNNSSNNNNHHHEEETVIVTDNNGNHQQLAPFVKRCKQFWKAGDFEEANGNDVTPPDVLMDHVRVHPKFLHSNATSHKWALGAFAELLDNSLDEVINGATFVNVDVLKNKKDGSMMLLVEDNGGGMNPDKMRQCMSLGYSAKSKMANTIGQYGNGFKTSTMRLGADVIVFSRCQGGDGKSQTQSIGLLSYTFLKATRKEDIVVPMIDFEKNGQVWKKTIRSSLNDWETKLNTILQWSPFVDEIDLLQQFNILENQGTRIIIYNLWEDDEETMELDFDADPHDIQIRGVNRDEKNIQMAKKYPNSRHFLTYQHSLRSYASILYLRLPPGFRIILRRKDVEHHNLVNDLMLSTDIQYKPLHLSNNDVATGKIGFVKDAHYHIDVQGFNVYHKNRLIKPFWRVWNAAGSDGRGVIGVLEANFVEPAHDKQGFERTTVLARLEAKLVKLQKEYWTTRCQEIGYAARRHSKNPTNASTEHLSCDKDKLSLLSNPNGQVSTASVKGVPLDNHKDLNGNSCMTSELKGVQRTPVNGLNSAKSYNNIVTNLKSQQSTYSHSVPQVVNSKDQQVATKGHVQGSSNLKDEYFDLTGRLNKTGGTIVDTLRKNLKYERERNQKLEKDLQEKTKQLETVKKEAEKLDQDNLTITDELLNERKRRSDQEERLMQRIRDASKVIEQLQERVRQLESRDVRSIKIEKD